MAARPSSATRTPTTTPRQTQTSRPPVRDFVGGRSFELSWDVRPVFDFVFSLSGDCGGTDDLPAADRGWLADAKATLSQAVKSDLEGFVEGELPIHVASFLVEHPELRTSDQAVAAIGSVPTSDLMMALLGDYDIDPDSTRLAQAAVHGDAEALDALLASKGEHGKGMRSLLADPPATHRRITSVLGAWAPIFREIEPRIAAIGERDLALRAVDRASLDDLDLIERTTGGVRWLPEAGIRRVVLAPSFFSRPFNFLLGGDGWRFFGYPVADEALDRIDPLEPPPSVLRLHRALGDPTRMRILKLLAGRDLYLTEIAQQLDLSKPTIKHHLALLRSAGLVTVTESAAVVYYSLRRARIDDASVELNRFLET